MNKSHACIVLDIPEGHTLDVLDDSFQAKLFEQKNSFLVNGLSLPVFRMRLRKLTELIEAYSILTDGNCDAVRTSEVTIDGADLLEQYNNFTSKQNQVKLEFVQGNWTELINILKKWETLILLFLKKLAALELASLEVKLSGAEDPMNLYNDIKSYPKGELESLQIEVSRARLILEKENS